MVEQWTSIMPTVDKRRASARTLLLLRAFETNHKISTRYMTSFNSRDFLINQVLTLNNASIKLSFKKQYQLIQMYKFYTFSHI